MRATHLLLLPVIFIGINTSALAKNKTIKTTKKAKHDVWITWGWNRDFFSKSDLRLTGENYDVTLQKIVANDRQSPFTFRQYFQPNQITIPQYNFRLGYGLRKNWSISFGFDHMKYVMVNNQQITLNGTINQGNNQYNGTYNNSNFTVKENFLTFEHTDGLNYLNLELRKNHTVTNLNQWIKSKYTDLELQVYGGFGAGIMFPRTNSKFLDFDRNDKFHVAGYGLASVCGIHFILHKYISAKMEVKSGFINMPRIRTTPSKSDNGKQNFYFLQENISFGLRYPI